MTEQTEGAEVEALRAVGYIEYVNGEPEWAVLLDDAEPVLARLIAAAEVRGAQAVLAAVEAEASSRSAGRLDVLRAARAAAAVTTSSAKSSDLATRVPQDESQRAAGGGGEG